MAKIALMGYGVVGSGLIELIDNNKSKIDNLEVSSILVRCLSKHEGKKYSEYLTDNVEEFFSKEIDIVVEVMGSLHPAYEYVKRALQAKKHVVTANKDLIAEYGGELLSLAKESGVTLKFEASVGGGIPILKPLIESLEGNSIKSIRGILNGTTNYILTKMYNENVDYEEALKEAQALGFAEANPDSDVLGYDAARKLAILSTIAYKNRISWKNINIEGINNLERQDFIYAKELGYRIKLIAESIMEGDQVYASVRPALVKEGSILSTINNEVNGVVFHGDAVGEVSFTGKGAGMLPTGSAVFGDVLDIIRGRKETSENYLNEILVNRYIDSEVGVLIRIKTKEKKNVIKKLRLEFPDLQLVGEKRDELALYINALGENKIQDALERLKLDGNIISFKKLLRAV